MTEVTATPAANARIYYELFDGVDVDSRISDLDLWMQIGGTQAAIDTNYQVSVYGRASLNGKNLVTIYRELIEVPDYGAADPDPQYVLVQAAWINGGYLTIGSQPDVPRNVTVSASAAQTQTIHVAGHDIYGNHVSEDLQLDGTTVVKGQQIFASLISVHQGPVPEGETPAWIYVGVGSLLPPTTYWHSVHVHKHDIDAHDVHCIVIKLEQISNTWTYTIIDPDKSYADQVDDVDPPPWGIKLTKAAIYASPLGRDVRLHRVFADILDHDNLNYSGGTVDWEPDQLAFIDIPKDRQDALDDVNGMLGYNYHCWNGTTVVFSAPSSGTAWEIDAGDPRTTWSIERGIDETYNCVRVCYTNAKGKPREVVLHHDETPLNFVRADTLQAPDSIKSQASAIRFGQRYLNNHYRVQVAGSVTITGDDGVVDPLLIRPGDTIKMTGPARFIYSTHEVTRVTLRPLDWTADLEFGSNSKRFDRWLARLAAGGHVTKRR